MTVDAFVVVTDQEKAGQEQPSRALERYRRAIGLAAKLVVIAMAAEHCEMTDPNDAQQMSVAGFDASVPEIVEQFLRAA